MSDLSISIQKNPAAWIYVMIPPAVVGNFGTIVINKRAEQEQIISDCAALGGWSSKELKNYIEQQFERSYGYSTMEGIRRLYQGIPIEKLSGIAGDNDMPVADMSSGEIDPYTGLPVSVLENGELAERRIGETADGSTPAWAESAVPTLGKNITMAQYISQNADHAWTVKDPVTGIVYTQTMDLTTGKPSAIYRTDTGQQCSWFNAETNTWVDTKIYGVQRVNYVFDQINQGLGQVANILQKVLGYIMDMIAANQATKGNYGLYNLLHGNSTSTQNSLGSAQQSDSVHFGGIGADTKKSGGDLTTLLLIGLGVYLVAKK